MLRLIPLAFLPLLLSATYYVQIGGSGSACTAIAPCLPTQPTLAAGDTVRVLPGSPYTMADIFRASGTGTGANVITYISDTPLAAVVRGGSMPVRNYIVVDGFFIDGQLALSGGHGMLLSTSTNVTVQNVEIRGQTDVITGHSEGGSDCAAEQDMSIGTGFLTNGSDITLQDSVIHGFNEAVSVQCDASDILIQDNYIYRCGNGLKYINPEGPVVVDGNVWWEHPNHLWEVGNNNCNVPDGARAAGVMPATMSLTLTNNIVVAGQEVMYSPSGRTVTMQNNTYWGPDPGGCSPMAGKAFYIRSGFPNPSGPITNKNNLYVSDEESNPFIGTFDGSSTAIITASNYNFVYRPQLPDDGLQEEFGAGNGIGEYLYSDWVTVTGQDVNTTRAVDPQFSDPRLYPIPASLSAARDRLRPQEGSPACTAGEGGTYVGAVACAGGGAPDTDAPDAVTTLSAGSPTSSSILLSWNATNDDGSIDSGVATSYQIRRRAGTDLTWDETEWAAGTAVSPPPPTPQASGTAQTLTVTGLSASTAYTFAMKVLDEVSNTSAISNGAAATTSAAASGDCADGDDDDLDGYADLLDIGCDNAADATETLPGGTTWTIPCTEGAYLQALADMCTAGGGITILFNCTNTTITIDWDTPSVGTAATRREIAEGCNNNTIDGENKGIWIEPDRRWSDALDLCGNQVCDIAPADGVPDRCPDCDPAGSCNAGDGFTTDNIPRFMVIRGDGNTIKGFGIRWWGDGFRFNSTDSLGVYASDNTIQDFECWWPGDACYSGDPGTNQARNNRLINTTARNACDKAYQLYGRDSGWADADDYDLYMENSGCINCNGCVRGNGDGFLRLENLIVDENDAPNAQFACDYGFFGDDDNPAATTAPFARITGVFMRNCEDGVLALDDTRIIVDGVDFINTNTSSVRVGGSANVVVQNSSISGANGLNVLVSHTGEVDFGGNPSPITFPVYGSVASVGLNDYSEATYGITSARASYTVYAEQGCWDDADPSNEVQGACIGGADEGELCTVDATCLASNCSAPEFADYSPLRSAASCGIVETVQSLRGCRIVGGSLR